MGGIGGLVWRTMVIGIVGAFGKMKATSSNFPRRRQFSASEILHEFVQSKGSKEV
jgi:hypothetical protein